MFTMTTPLSTTSRALFVCFVNIPSQRVISKDIPFEALSTLHIVIKHHDANMKLYKQLH
jgi:hypothetical protein